MTRFLAAALLVTVALSSAPLALARTGSGGFALLAPATSRANVTTAATLRLPAGISAVDGRVMFDTSVAQLVGVAPSGKGTALAPVEIAGGAAFGAYGLSSGSSLRLVFAIQRDGRLGLRLAVDGAADALGNRVYSAGSLSATIAVGSTATPFAAPIAVTALQPLRAAVSLRDVNDDSRASKLDLDVLRASWESARASGTTCGSADSAADANGDGCLDVVDLQSALAASSASADAVAGTSARATLVAANATFTVTSTADTADKTPGDGKCADSNGKCTLRAAITESNWMHGDNRIVFNLPGSAPVLIKLNKESNPIIQDSTGGLEIDGYTQPGAKVNTANFGSNAIPGVEIRGTGQNPAGNAFRMTSANNRIRGFLLNSFWRAIYLDGGDAHHNEIVGNIIGLDKGGGIGFKGENGVRLNVGAHDNAVGGPAPADRNVIGPFKFGVELYGPGTDSNVIRGNVMCMSTSGNTPANCGTGVDFAFGPKNNIVGGPQPNQKNVIGRSLKQGVELAHGWDPDTEQSTDKWQINGNLVIGNWIGFKGNGTYDPEFASGQEPPNTNDGNGVNIYDGSNRNIVDGNFIGSKYDGVNLMSVTSTGNIIRNNMIGMTPQGGAAPIGRFGIHVREGTRSNLIAKNKISNVARDGIVLGDPPVGRIRITQNIITNTNGRAIYLQADPAHAGQGANNLLAAPKITRATIWRAFGTGKPGSVIEVYRASRAIGLSGLPVAYLGSGVVAMDGTFVVSIKTAKKTKVVALQIDANGNTSMLGKNVLAKAAPEPLEPVAGFDWTQQANRSVAFDDSTTRNPTAWAWDFGDGETSSDRNPNHTFAMVGDYSVTLNVSNATGSDSITRQVTVAESGGTQTYVRDAFARSATAGWGSADVGGTYGLQGVASDYNVAGGFGTILSTAGGTRGALLAGVLRRDVDVRFRVRADKVATGGNFIIYATTRKISNSEYRPRLVFNANGTISVGASVVSGGTENPIELPIVVSGLTQAPGKFIWLRAQVTGVSPTTIRVKAWEDGQIEPTDWQFTATDALGALQAPGSVGLRTFITAGITNGPILFGFDDYSVVSIQ